MLKSMRQKIFLAFALTCGFGVALYASETVSAMERRLAWTQVGSHMGKAPDWDDVAARAQAAGLTDLMVLLSMNDGAYFSSTVTAVRVKFVAAFGDQLAKCAAACHRHGLKCHAWRYLWLVVCNGEMRQRMEAEGRLQVRRSPSADGIWCWLCPGDPRNRGQEVDALLEMASRGVDGIHLDYMRYDGDFGCFCDSCRRRFEVYSGKTVQAWPGDVCAGGKLSGQWDAFRRWTIDSLLEEVSRRVRCERPGIEISAAVQPFTYSTRCAQDWPRWCKMKWIDFVCPMDYRGDCEALRMAAEPQGRVMVETGVPIYPGIGVISSMSRLDAAAVLQQVSVLRKLGFRGFSLFSLHRDVYGVFESCGGACWRSGSE